MAWPPSTGNPNFFVEQGITTVVWGTDGMFVGYIVESITGREVVETLYVENGVGLRAVRILLVQGKEFDMTVVDDTRLVPPAPGTTISVIDPVSRITATFVVISNDVTNARKAEGRRTIRGVLDHVVDGV